MKFAQILHGKAHWIFESETIPEFAPNIKIVEITDKPEVQEGWSYDGDTNSFTPSEEDSPDNEDSPTINQQELMDYIIGLDFRLLMIETGIIQ